MAGEDSGVGAERRGELPGQPGLPDARLAEDGEAVRRPLPHGPFEGSAAGGPARPPGRPWVRRSDGRRGSAGNQVEEPPCGERTSRPVRAGPLDGLQHGGVSKEPPGPLPHQDLAFAAARCSRAATLTASPDAVACPEPSGRRPRPLPSRRPLGSGAGSPDPARPPRSASSGPRAARPRPAPPAARRPHGRWGRRTGRPARRRPAPRRVAPWRREHAGRQVDGARDDPPTGFRVRAIAGAVGDGEIDEHDRDGPAAPRSQGSAARCPGRVECFPAAGPAAPGGSRSSDGSCRRIACSSCRRAGPGSIPSSSTSASAGVPVDLERLGLSSRAIQRQHQLASQALSERMLGDQRLQLGHELDRGVRAPGRRRSAPRSPPAAAPPARRSPAARRAGR